MRIVIDMQGAQTESRFRGIGRYSLAFAQGVVRNRGEHEVFLVLNGMLQESIMAIREAFLDVLPQSHIRVWYAQGPVADHTPDNAARRDIAAHTRQACIDALAPDVVHVTSAVEGYIDDAVIGQPTLHDGAVLSATLYDLIPLARPEQYLDNNPVYKAHYLDKVETFKGYDLLLSISEFAREEALSLLSLAQDHVVNVSTAADDVFVPQTDTTASAALLETFELREGFVLYSGGADERKNLPRLIEAFAQVKSQRPSLQLVFAGKMPQYHIDLYTSQARERGLSSEDLVFTGYITDEQLRALYATCGVYVFPSWHEGFGLPPLEAMKCGAPVIGANASSVPEVIGWEDALFDPYDVDAIAAKLQQVLDDDEFRNQLIERGLQQAERFSWDNTARAAWIAFENAVGDTPRTRMPAEDDAAKTLVATLANHALLEGSGVDVSRLAKCIDYSVQPVQEKSRLFVDISELCKHDGKSGIQRVVRSILLEWLRNPPECYEINPVYTLPGETFYRHANHFIARFLEQAPEAGLQDEAITYSAGDIYLGLDLLMDVLPHKTAFFDVMREHGVSILFVVYDLLILQLPHCFVDSLQAHYIKWINIVAQYDGALCISHAVASELREWETENASERSRPLRIGAFHLGADIDQSVPSKGFPEDPAQRAESLLPNPTCLMVGTLEPRKGHAQALEAFELLWEAGVEVNLVIVGKHGWLVDELADKLHNHPQNGKRLLWLSGASDEYLEYLYRNADCLVAASYGEGFGLPLIEAAQYALPIIARDLPVFREVAGEHAWYFDGQQTSEIAERIAEWLELFERGEHPGSADMPWMTWKGSAQQLLGEIEKCAL